MLLLLNILLLNILLCMGLAIIVVSWVLGGIKIIKNKQFARGSNLIKCGSIFGAIIALFTLFSFLVRYGAEAISINEVDVALSSLLALVLLGALRALAIIREKRGDAKSTHREKVSDGEEV